MDKYKWNFTTIGGVTRVCIDDGQAIAHLNELDQKLWTVLSCPVQAIELDKKTLDILDSNGDGKIHVNEMVAASQWLTKIINDPDLLLKKDDFIPLSAFNEDDAEGKQLKASAIQILKNLGLEKDSISISDTADSIAIFSKTKFNGDGVITDFIKLFKYGKHFVNAHSGCSLRLMRVTENSFREHYFSFFNIHQIHNVITSSN